jgi:hypothetical protein
VQLAAGVGAGALEAPGGDGLDQAGDPARWAAAERDHASGREQERGRADTRSQCDRRAEQPEADRSARKVTGERGAGGRALGGRASVNHESGLA